MIYVGRTKFDGRVKTAIGVRICYGVSKEHLYHEKLPEINTIVTRYVVTYYHDFIHTHAYIYMYMYYGMEQLV